MFDGIHDLGLFIAAGLLLNLTPGADMALVASRSASQGFRAGAAAALGVGAGCWVHTAAAALGLSAIAAGSPAAYTALRWVGAAYLVWLGLGLLRTRPAGATPAAGATANTLPCNPPPTTLPWRRLFGQGFLTNALNPKVALFFLAFVPQFIDSGAPHKALAFIVLGTVFVVNSTLVNLALAWVVAALKRRLGQHGSMARLGMWLNRGVGALFVALGAKLAFDSTRT